MNVFRYAPKNRMAILKKKNEPSSTNNQTLQNKLRKINEQPLNNSILFINLSAYLFIII